MMKLIFTLSLGATSALAAPPPAAQPGKVHYKNPLQTQNFEELMVKGQVYRPDLTVVTSDLELGAMGALRLRNDFKDVAKTSIADEDDQ